MKSESLGCACVYDEMNVFISSFIPEARAYECLNVEVESVDTVQSRMQQVRCCECETPSLAFHFVGRARNTARFKGIREVHGSGFETNQFSRSPKVELEMYFLVSARFSSFRSIFTDTSRKEGGRGSAYGRRPSFQLVDSQNSLALCYHNQSTHTDNQYARAGGSSINALTH